MNLRRTIVLYGRLAGFVLLIECITFWGWSRWCWTPIQAHYMGAYVWSYLPQIASAYGLNIRWIWKTDQRGNRELATEDDAIRSVSRQKDEIRIRLSESAREMGWTGLVEGVSERVPPARLRSVLSDQIFEGQSVWIFVLLPGLIGFAAAIFLLQCLIWLEDWLPEMPWQRQRLPWEDPVPTIFDRWATWVMRRIRPPIAHLHCAVTRRAGSQLAVSSMALTEEKDTQKAKSRALPVFGASDVSRGRVYVWSERDEID
jgi:hypothetical protein